MTGDDQLELELIKVHLLIKHGDQGAAQAALSEIIRSHPDYSPALSLQAEITDSPAETQDADPPVGTDWRFLFGLFGTLFLGVLVFSLGVAWTLYYILEYMQYGQNGMIMDPGWRGLDIERPYPVGLLILYRPAILIVVGIWIVYRRLRREDNP